MNDGESTLKILTAMGCDATIDEAITLEHKLFGELSAAHRDVLSALQPLMAAYSPAGDKPADQVITEIVRDLIQCQTMLVDMTKTCRQAQDVVKMAADMLRQARARLAAAPPTGGLWWVVIGRMHGADESTSEVYDAPDRDRAVDAFVESQLGESYATDWREWPESDPRGRVYIDSVWSCGGAQLQRA